MRADAGGERHLWGNEGDDEAIPHMYKSWCDCSHPHASDPALECGGDSYGHVYEEIAHPHVHSGELAALRLRTHGSRRLRLFNICLIDNWHASPVTSGEGFFSLARAAQPMRLDRLDRSRPAYDGSVGSVGGGS